jgi:hypothetical protein
MGRKQERAGMNPDKGTLRANRKAMAKELSKERQEWLKGELDKARAKSDDELAMLAVSMLGRKRIWQLVKHELREKALGVE